MSVPANLASRQSIYKGTFQYRLAPSAPPPAKKVRVEPPPQKPSRMKAKQVSAFRCPPINMSLPENERLALLLELALNHERSRIYGEKSSKERDQYEASARKIVDCARYQTSIEKEIVPNPENEKLSQREMQLKAIAESYRKELVQWEQVQDIAEQEPMEVASLPEDEVALLSCEVAAAKDVVASSTRAVESHILTTDHICATLKRLESRTRRTRNRVQEVAASLNDRVLAEISNTAGSGLTPPQDLVKVQTRNLRVSSMSRES